MQDSVPVDSGPLAFGYGWKRLATYRLRSPAGQKRMADSKESA